MPLKKYKARIRELENDPLVLEYITLNKLVLLSENPEFKLRVNSPIEVNEKNITRLDEIEKNESNIVLKLLRWAGRASTVNEINNAHHEFYNETAELKYKIRHQFKRGNIYLLSYNESRKYSFYVMPEWLEDGKLKNKYLPLSSNAPLMIDSIRIKSYDGKINKEMQ